MKPKASKFTNPWAILSIALLILCVLRVTAQTYTARYLLSLVLIATAAFFVCILIHELGHLLAGFLVKFDFIMLAIGPLALLRKDNRLHLTAFDNRTAFLGLTLFFPSDYVNLRWRLIWLIAGGPIASLLLFIAAFVFLSAHPINNDDFLLNTPLWTFLKLIQYIFWESIVILWIAMVPSTQPATDGGKLYRLLPGGPRSQRWVTITLTDFANIKGVRPRDWQWAKGLIEMTDVSADAALANYLAYRWALDNKDIAQAGKRLDRMLECRFKAAPPLRAQILVEAGYFEMRYRDNKKKANDWFEQIGSRQKLVRPLTLLRSIAATHFREGKVSEARALAEKMSGLLGKAQNGISLGEAELFRDILEQCDKAEGAVTSPPKDPTL